MENEVVVEEVITAEAASAAGDLSFWSLFFQADMVVKLVMIALIVASVWCWAIIIEKLMNMKKLKASTDEFENEFWAGQTLEQLFEAIRKGAVNPMSAVFGSAMREWGQSRKVNQVHINKDHLLQRIQRAMSVAITREMDRLERNMNFLASVGSVAPFIGLFGTVWGIMNSFTAIAHSEDTSLAIVAPGIAEALAATALGLVAAIPAVVAYNRLSLTLNRYHDRLENFSDEFSSIVSRQLENQE